MCVFERGRKGARERQSEIERRGREEEEGKEKEKEKKAKREWKRKDGVSFSFMCLPVLIVTTHTLNLRFPSFS